MTPLRWQRLLGSQDGPLLAPVRSELFGAERFAQHGRSLGLAQPAQKPAWGGSSFFPRLRSNVRVLQEAHAAIVAQSSQGEDISPASLWLMDNFHLIESQLLAIHEGLPRSYFRALPVLQAEPLSGLPRIYGVAWAFVAHTDSAFDEDLLLHFLCAYQETRELNLSEMWALPTTLRVVLVENLRRLAERVATHQAAREAANHLCDNVALCTLATLQPLLDTLRARGAAEPFLAQMGRRLQERTGNLQARVPAEVQRWLQAELPNLAALHERQSADQTADNLSVSNAVNSLRAIGDADWPDIVARTSTLMRLMLTSPLFAAEHHTTRDQTLHSIERLARRSGRSELQVAQTLLGLMQDASAPAPSAGTGLALVGAVACSNGSPEPRADWHDAALAGHWLQGPGRPALAAALGLPALTGRVLWGWRLPGTLPPGLRPWVLPVYLGTVATGTWALVSALLRPDAAAGLGLTATVWATLLLAWPASEAVIAFLHRLISESTAPRHLPRLSLAQGIAPEQRVLVVIPCMLSAGITTAELVRRLELHHLANPEPCAQFALLTDWADADAVRVAGDDDLLQQATQLITDLNARYAPPCNAGTTTTPPPRFLLLHRHRRYSSSERRWIGWERKRGKLEQLLALLADGLGLPQALPPAFADLGPLSQPAPGTRYVLTLDSDTQLPPGRLRDLVGVAAHPANRPRLGAGGRRVVAGYGILQPRLVTPLPLPREDTLFHRLFAGQSGVDPYSAASSEVYQDLFEEGSFTGKGLLDVQAMHAVMAGRLPEGQVLSHDLLEGALARCAAVTDVTLVEDAPFHAEVAASRVHRWTRGDWQLLPILLRSLVQPWRYPLGAVNRWKMADNLRRSLVAPLSLALIVLSLAGGAVQPAAALLLVLAAFTAGPLMGALTGFVPQREAVARRHFYQQALGDLGRALGGGLWHLAMLLQHSATALDAILRALYRMVFSHRLLLQWTTAATAQASAREDLASALRRHGAVPPAALLLWAALWSLHGPQPLLAAAVCLLWAGAPLWSWWASRSGVLRQPQACPPATAARLQAIARDTWRYFERTVTATDNHLPPDNLQTAPHEMLAHRTSPTNIGLYLLAAVCMRQFGGLSTAELLQRLQDTLATLDRLPRHRGHFLNWYDTQTCAPLLPMYVSTVDSGNLSGHLLTVAQGCLAFADEARGAASAAHPSAAPAPRCDDTTALHRAQLRAVAAHCQRLAWQADFAFLYHPRRHLLHIGYRVADQELDAGFYDLLASESRLTSLLAIAKGDVPVRHWQALGRPFFAVGATAGLRSWSGSMFEYLMPTLVLAEPHGSVLRQAGLAALAEQRRFAAEQGVPWGVSESAYAGCDHTLAYQYAPQGVPLLALRSTPPDELVIAPYATALAAQLDAVAADLNYQALQQLGARDGMGYIEALDYTPARQTGSTGVTPVQTFMAHHQGMTIVALANVLQDGVVQRWGMADAHIEAVSSLLHERAPREVGRLVAAPTPAVPLNLRRLAPALQRKVRPGQNAIEPTQLLSNGRYSVALRAHGAGRSRHGSNDITRWRDDALRDAHGHFFWLRRQPAGPLVSMTQHPAPDPEAEYDSDFHTDRVVFDTTWPDLHARITVWVSPEDDIEFRQVELSNLGGVPLQVELLSAFEVALADSSADEAHPAFSNLFVQARSSATHQALLFDRRPRLASEAGLHMAHFLAEATPPVPALRYQVDRQAWLGRNRAPWSPRAALLDLAAPAQWRMDGLAAVPTDTATDTTTSEPVPGTPDGETERTTGLDPVCVLAAPLRIAPGAKARLIFATAASADPAVLQAVIDKYRHPMHVERASLMSATLAGIRLRALRMGAETYTTLQSLTTAMMLSLARVAAPQAHAHAQAQATGAASGASEPSSGPQALDRRLLWRFGISGDRPLVLVLAAALPDLALVRSLGKALSLWAWGGVACDLVVINAEPASYLMALQRDLKALRDRHDADLLALDAQVPGGAQTGWHLLRAEDLSATDLQTLAAQARLHLLADGRPLAAHLNAWAARHEQALSARQGGSRTALPAAAHQAAEAAVSRGEFTHTGAAEGDFVFSAGSAQRPQRPWVNVLANPGFGTLVSEAGGGYTWAANSRLNQITPWSNDPVADAPGEWLLLQDCSSRELWSVLPSAHGQPGVAYRITHGQGHSRAEHQRGSLQVSAQWCVDAHSAIKQVQLQVLNQGPNPRQLRWVVVCEWLLGAQRRDRLGVHTALHRPPHAQGRWVALLATQQDHSAGFGGGTAFMALQPDGAAEEEAYKGPQGLRSAPRAFEDPADWTCDRRECFDARGHPVVPDHFAQQQGSGLDPCAAVSHTFTVPPGGRSGCTQWLGWAASPEAAHALIHSTVASVPAERLAQARAGWQVLLNATTVQTPDPLFNTFVNRWLLYQTVACRLWAKAAFYQAGGATGFRDQLQDAMALAWAEPGVLRAQIVLSSARQFAQGDVQHWWHAPTGAGVRTHFSDDLLWLPFALQHYLQHTGDTTVLDEPVPFIEGLHIAPGAEDIYGTPQVSTEVASVYEHAARSIDRSLRVGVHGLPLMGSGDWNDGMNRVGHQGRGESVWLAWFLCTVVAHWAPLALARGDGARAQQWQAAAQGWRAALAGPAWDGHWYQRAFFDDGQPLGSHHNTEARIALVAQAWAVLSGEAPTPRQLQALASVHELLLDEAAGLVRLLHPPLAHAQPSAGYIQAYPPGVRENGGQYSHAGVWALMAQSAHARTLADPAAASAAHDRAWQYFRYLSPPHRMATAAQAAAYGAEPYVMAGDVYTAPPYVGRGGWSWYTGAAGWMHRAAIESILGLHLTAQTFSVHPGLPSHWPQAQLTLRRAGRALHFLLLRQPAHAALRAAATWAGTHTAQLLLPAQVQAFLNLPGQAYFVVPLGNAGAGTGPDDADGAAASSGDGAAEPAAEFAAEPAADPDAAFAATAGPPTRAPAGPTPPG